MPPLLHYLVLQIIRVPPPWSIYIGPSASGASIFPKQKDFFLRYLHHSQRIQQLHFLFMKFSDMPDTRCSCIRPYIWYTGKKHEDVSGKYHHRGWRRMPTIWDLKNRREYLCKSAAQIFRWRSEVGEEGFPSLWFKITSLIWPTIHVSFTIISLKRALPREINTTKYAFFSEFPRRRYRFHRIGMYSISSVIEDFRELMPSCLLLTTLLSEYQWYIKKVVSLAAF